MKGVSYSVNEHGDGCYERLYSSALSGNFPCSVFGAV
jgi:hypothetical protein